MVSIFARLAGLAQLCMLAMSLRVRLEDGLRCAVCWPQEEPVSVMSTMASTSRDLDLRRAPGELDLGLDALLGKILAGDAEPARSRPLALEVLDGADGGPRAPRLPSGLLAVEACCKSNRKRGLDMDWFSRVQSEPVRPQSKKPCST